MRSTKIMVLGSRGHLCLHTDLPTCILPAYWIRHHLSRQDIDIITNYIPTKLLWLCALGQGILCPWFMFRTSSSSQTDITMSGKSTAIDLILKHTGYVPPETNQLDVSSLESLDHIPPIPRISVGLDTINLLSTHISGILYPRSLLDPADDQIPEVSCMYRVHGLDVIPLGLEGTAIHCVAVVKESEYLSTLVQCSSRSYTHDPRVCLYKSQVYCLTDESVLLSS